VGKLLWSSDWKEWCGASSANPVEYKAKPPEGGFNRHAAELALPRLRGWVNPERDPDSCQLSLVTRVIMAIGNSEFKPA
jgi:hypothetical protein